MANTPNYNSAPLFTRGELNQFARTIGAFLTMVGGFVIIIQSLFVTLLPPPNGYIETVAVVTSRVQRGSFLNPAFSITLTYSSSRVGGIERVRSGRRVEFEQYRVLSTGDVISIYYSPDDPFEWVIAADDPELSDFSLGILMIVFGGFSLAFPLIIKIASRETDFERIEHEVSMQ